MEREMGRRIGAAGAVLQSLYRCDEQRAEPEGQALSTGPFSFLPSPMVMKDGS